MRGVYIRQESPFYWLRYYDKYEQNTSRKRKSLNTKIEVTEADRKRAAKRLKLIGTSKLRELATSFQNGLAQRNIEINSGVKLRFDLLLSEGYEEFKQVRRVPGSKRQIKEKTIINYTLAINHMIAACTDKKIYKYTGEKDYVALLYHFDEVKVPGKTIINKDGSETKTTKKMSQNTRSIYTRSLRSLWNYFCDKNYATKNIIEPVDSEEKDPDPIPPDEMFSIITYLKDDKKYPHHYQLIYFMLLTGCRPSSAMVQLKENIDFKRKIISIENVKTGKKKGKVYYQFPLYKELNKLLMGMNIKQGDTGRLFDMFTLNEVNYTYPLSFWERSMKLMKIGKLVSNYYMMKQIRSTTASFLINVLKMKVLTVKRLLDHSDIKITDKHYIQLNLGKVRMEMDDIELEDLLNSDKYE